jgi:hypothetical protein
MGRIHDGTINIKRVEPQRALARARFRVTAWWLPFCVLVLAIKLLLLWLDPTPTLFMGFMGRLGRLHSYGAERLDFMRPIVLLRLPGTLVRRLAAQFYSAFTNSGARQWRNSDCVCLDLRLLLRNVESSFLLFGLLCALDPCQLVWERYVMTETFSLVV